MKTLELTENQIWAFYKDDVTLGPIEDLEHVDSIQHILNFSGDETYELVFKKEDVLYKIKVNIWGHMTLRPSMSSGPYVAKEVRRREKTIVTYEEVR